MKAQRTAVTYYREKSCTEDVIAIANEIARGKTLAVALSAKKELYPRSTKKHKGVH